MYVKYRLRMPSLCRVWGRCCLAANKAKERQACYHCGNPGHFKRICKAAEKKASEPRSNRKTRSSRCYGAHTDCPIRQSPQDRSSHWVPTQHCGQLHCNSMCKWKSMHLIVDSGSMVSIIKKKHCFCRDPAVENIPLRTLTGGTSSSAELCGAVVEIELGRLRIPTS